MNCENERQRKDAIREAYDTGYNDARNNSASPGDNAPGYRGQEVERKSGQHYASAIGSPMCEFGPHDEIARLRSIIGDIKNYAHKADDVVRWCDEALKSGHNLQKSCGNAALKGMR